MVNVHSKNRLKKHFLKEIFILLMIGIRTTKCLVKFIVAQIQGGNHLNQKNGGSLCLMEDIIYRDL